MKEFLVFLLGCGIVYIFSYYFLARPMVAKRIMLAKDYPLGTDSVEVIKAMSDSAIKIVEETGVDEIIIQSEKTRVVKNKEGKIEIQNLCFTKRGLTHVIASEITLLIIVIGWFLLLGIGLYNGTVKF